MGIADRSTVEMNHDSGPAARQVVITGRVTVRPKPGVLDPEAQAIGRELSTLGFDEVQSIVVGKVFEVRVEARSAEAAHERLEQMAERLLANPVIETWQIDVL